MSTTSTVTTVKAQIVDQLTTALPVPVFYAWPGKVTPNRCVFLGPHPETADVRIDVSSTIPTIKSARKQRQENYSVRITIWSFRPDLSVDGAKVCEVDAFAILGPVEDVFAEDPRIGLDPTVIQHSMIESIASTLFPFQAGWACELAVDLAVSARLQ